MITRKKLQTRRPHLARYTVYDYFAWVYNKHWGTQVIDHLIPVTERLLLGNLPAGARILDLCCGPGHLVQALLARGYNVTGLDGSDMMLDFARKNATRGEFILADARSFRLPQIYHAVVSTYDSLNHITNSEELLAVFRNVYATLQSDGYFLFDVTLADGYQAYHGHTLSFIEDDHVCLIRLNYRSEEQIRQSDLTIFRLAKERWQRSDFMILEKSYSVEEMLSHLRAAGFMETKTYEAQRDLGLPYIGRIYFVSRKFGSLSHT